MPARRIADAVNVELAEQPSTRKYQIGRAAVERLLAADSRFERIAVEGLEVGWRLREKTRAELAVKGLPRLRFSPLGAAARPKLYAWQLEALDVWRRANKRGIVEAVTGAGKTMVGIAAIAQTLATPRSRAAVIVPTVELMHQWLSRLRATFDVPVGSVGDGTADRFADNAVLVYVARSAADSLPIDVSREPQLDFVLLVADECHRYGSGVFSQALDAQFRATLGLSATPERDYDDGMAAHVIPRLGPVIFTYGHERGISERTISDFRLCFVGIDFQPPERAEHDHLTREIARCRSALIAAHPFLERAVPFLAAVKMIASRSEDDLARRFLHLAGERRRLLNGARARHDFVAWLVKNVDLRRERMLFFHESIADCEILARALSDAGIPALAHHSEMDGVFRAAALRRFGAGEIQALVAPRTLDEGVDVPEASLAVIVAGTRVKRQSVQRIGRVLRRTAEKREAKVLKIFVRGAADDPTLRSRDPFSSMMLASGRASIRLWPLDAGEIIDFILPAHQPGPTVLTRT